MSNITIKRVIALRGTPETVNGTVTETYFPLIELTDGDWQLQTTAPKANAPEGRQKTMRRTASIGISAQGLRFTSPEECVIQTAKIFVDRNGQHLVGRKVEDAFPLPAGEDWTFSDPIPTEGKRTVDGQIVTYTFNRYDLLRKAVNGDLYKQTHTGWKLVKSATPTSAPAPLATATASEPLVQPLT